MSTHPKIQLSSVILNLIIISIKEIFFINILGKPPRAASRNSVCVRLQERRVTHRLSRAQAPPTAFSVCVCVKTFPFTPFSDSLTQLGSGTPGEAQLLRKL